MKVIFRNLLFIFLCLPILVCALPAEATVPVADNANLMLSKQVIELQQQALTAIHSDQGNFKQYESNVFLGATVKGKLDVAEMAFKHAYELAPNRLDLAYSLASVRILQGNIDGAIKVYRSIETRYPNDLVSLVYQAAYADALGESGVYKLYLSELAKEHNDNAKKYINAIQTAQNTFNIDINTITSPKPDNRKDLVILVLGYALKSDGSMDSKLIDRLTVALNAATTYPNAKIIVSGGVPEGGVTEAYLMRQWLIEHGIKPGMVIMEDKSIDTVANIQNSLIVISKLKPKTVLLVTSASHIRRATAILSQAKNDLQLNFSIDNVVAWDWDNSSGVKPASATEKALIMRDTLRMAGMWAYPGMER